MKSLTCIFQTVEDTRRGYLLHANSSTLSKTLNEKYMLLDASEFLQVVVYRMCIQFGQSLCLQINKLWMGISSKFRHHTSYLSYPNSLGKKAWMMMLLLLLLLLLLL
jgi:hypothetical protein